MSSRWIDSVHCQSLLIKCPLSLDHNPLSLSFHKNTHREMEPHTVLALHVVFINTHCHHHAAMEQPHIQHLQSKRFQNYTHVPTRPPLKRRFPQFIYLHIYIQNHKAKHVDHTMRCILSAHVHSFMCTLYVFVSVCKWIHACVWSHITEQHYVPVKPKKAKMVNLI